MKHVLDQCSFHDFCICSENKFNEFTVDDNRLRSSCVGGGGVF